MRISGNHSLATHPFAFAEGEDFAHDDVAQLQHVSLGLSLHPDWIRLHLHLGERPEHISGRVERSYAGSVQNFGSERDNQWDNLADTMRVLRNIRLYRR